MSDSSDPLGITDWFNTVYFPVFSRVFFGGRRDWITDPILAAVFRAIAEPDASKAADILLEELDVDRQLLIDSWSGSH